MRIKESGFEKNKVSALKQAFSPLRDGECRVIIKDKDCPQLAFTMGSKSMTGINIVLQLIPYISK